MKEVEGTIEGLEKELERFEKELGVDLEGTLKELDKGGDLVGLLKADLARCKESLKGCEKALEDTKFQVQQNDGQKESSERKLVELKEQVEAAKEKLKGIYIKFSLFRH